MTPHFTRRLAIAMPAAAALATPGLVKASAPRRWRMATSWARNMQGPGVSARRLAEQITAMSNGELVVDVFAAGELAPALQVFDAVSTGAVDMAHTAALFWGGKMPAAPLFTTWPFGLTPAAHVGWLGSGGQALWDELYRPFDVRAFAAGNTGPSACGWFRRPVTSTADLKGLRIRATGLGGEVYAALGAIPVAIPPADVYAALERGVIDAVELLAPANDEPAGFYRVAPNLVLPGFNKPNGASELLVKASAFQALPTHLQTVIEVCCKAEHDRALGDVTIANAKALQRLVAAGVSVHWLDTTALTDARRAADGALARIAKTSDVAGRIIAHVQTYAAEVGSWQRIGAHAERLLAGP